MAATREPAARMRLTQRPEPKREQVLKQSANFSKCPCTPTKSVAPEPRLQIHAQRQPVDLTQRSALSEVAPFSDRLAFVGRRFCRRRGSCPLYLAPSRAQTCRTRLFASWAIYCRLFRTSYYSPADGNDTNECVSTLSSKNDDRPLFCSPRARAFEFACKPGRKSLKEIRFSSGLFP
jgi:hypothetical protein